MSDLHGAGAGLLKHGLQPLPRPPLLVPVDGPAQGLAQGALAHGLGAGGHLVLVEPALQAVVVARWLDPAATEEFVERALVALR